MSCYSPRRQERYEVYVFFVSFLSSWFVNDLYTLYIQNHPLISEGFQSNFNRRVWGGSVDPIDSVYYVII